MSAYANDRVEKISQIMPEFARVARSGDRVMMGLEGDPLFPNAFNTSRPEGTIGDVQYRENDALVTINMDDGSQKVVSSLSLASEDTWEFTNDAFKNVLERNMPKVNRAEEPVATTYRNTESDMIESLQAEIADLRETIQMQAEQMKKFQNVMISGLNEVANDVNHGTTNFCQTLTSEFTKMKNRAEGGVVEAPTSEVEYRGMEDDMSEISCDETEYF